MTRPRTQAEHLARLVPASVAATSVGRRSLLRGSLLAAGVVGAPGLLAACGGDGGSGGGGGTVTLGSNYSDEIPRRTVENLVAAFEEQSGLTVDVNTIDHTTYQNNINNYLQGSPDDVFAWFAGYRMRFFAEQGLAGPISDVWEEFDGFSEAFREASTASDGEQYFVPTVYGPWAVFHRRSLFEERGYQAPATMDEFRALAAQMQQDGLVPLAFADQEGWPAMGTFDQLNMRLNGYDFHINLLAGEESWTSPQVKSVFEAWRELLPFHQDDALGRTWQDAAAGVVNKTSGMMLIGSFISQQFSDAEREDLDFFNFPEIDPAIGAGAVEAPIDGFMMSRRPRNEEGAKQFLTFLGSAESGLINTQTDPAQIAANADTDTAHYTELQRKAAEFVNNAENISQFMDRDTRPDFASTVMIPALQSFLDNPDDIDGLVTSIEQQKQSIFRS